VWFPFGGPFTSFVYWFVVIGLYTQLNRLFLHAQGYWYFLWGIGVAAAVSIVFWICRALCTFSIRLFSRVEHSHET
jgi:hypothetical protein